MTQNISEEVSAERFRIHGELCGPMQAALWHVPEGPDKDKIRAAFMRAFPAEDTVPCIVTDKTRADKIPHPSGDDGGDGLAWVPERIDDQETAFEVAQTMISTLEVLPDSTGELRGILVDALKKLPGGMGVVSDGHHTIDELYDHRRALAALLATIASVEASSWRSRSHHPDDETPMFDGCFIVGIELPTGDIRYHYGVEHWDEFSNVPEVSHAPLWDGAGPDQTIERMKAAAALPLG